MALRYGVAARLNGLRDYILSQDVQTSAASAISLDGAFWRANVVHRTQGPKIQCRLYCEILERRLTSARIESEESYAGALY